MNWKVGNTKSVVVSDEKVTNTNFPSPPNLKISDDGDIEFYGGYLICESIGNKDHAKLIAAAPDLFSAIKYYFDVLKEANGINWDAFPDHTLEKMQAAFKKAGGVIAILLLLSITASAQFTKKDIPVYGCMFAAGAFYGQAEKLIWHNPYPNSTFWNPYKSWEKTDKKTIKLDGYHLMRFGQDAAIVGAVVLSVNDFKGKNKFWKITQKALLCSASFWAGQQVTYKLIK